MDTKTMTANVPGFPPERRKLLRAIQRVFEPGYVDMLPAEQWPEDAAITVPVFVDVQQRKLEQLGFRVEDCNDG